MKQYLLLFFALSVAVSKFTNNCGYTQYYSYTNILKICYPDNYDADADVTHYLRINYQNTEGEETLTGWKTLDNLNCDDFTRGTCDYFDVIPDDVASLNFIDMSAHETDGLQFAVIEIGYADGAGAAFLDIDIANNECYSRLQEEVSEPEAVWMNVGDVCQTIRIRFGEADEFSKQYTSMVYGIQQCIQEYDYVIGEISGDCDSCFDQIHTAAYCGQETNCGAEYADNDQHLKLCISIYDYADTDDFVYARFSYTSTGGEYTTSDWLLVDNVLCDDFQQSYCDYFDIVPTDIEEMDRLDIWLDGQNGMQIQQIVVKYQADKEAHHFGSVENDCISYQTEYEVNRDPEYIFLDASDACKIARVQFGASYEGTQNSDAIYALQEYCDCTVPYIDYAQTDCDSCYIYCNPDITCGQDECAVVTVYEDFNYQGEFVEVSDFNDCLPFIPESICIPNGKKATVYGACDYEDESFELYASSENLHAEYHTDHAVLLGKSALKSQIKSKKQLQKENAVIKIVVE